MKYLDYANYSKLIGNVIFVDIPTLHWYCPVL